MDISLSFPESFIKFKLVVFRQSADMNSTVCIVCIIRGKNQRAINLSKIMEPEHAENMRISSS